MTIRGVIRLGALKRVRRNLVDEARVKDDLTITNGAYWAATQNGASTDQLPTLQLYREDGDYLEVPRHYKLPLTTHPSKLVRVYDRFARHRYYIKHYITLRNDTQSKAANALLANSNDKILSLSCGKGKTVVSLFAAAEGRRFPLLIVVHTNALMDQWRENYGEDGQLIGGIMKFYGLHRDDIGWIQQEKCEWRGKKIAIAMLHTLVRKTFPDDFYTYWRLVIVDEVHRLGAAHFSKACSMLPCERWGLSATLERSDGMDAVIQMHMGKVAYKNLSQDLQATAIFVDSGVSLSEQQMSRFRFRRGRINMGQFTTWLCDHEERNRKILSYIEQATQKGRISLVLGERVKQLYELCDALKVTDSKAVLVGPKKKDERQHALKQQVVFATQHLAREGLDRASFDTVFILVTFGGHGRLQQSVGRIERLLENKNAPKAIIFTDNISIIQALENKMKAWFHKNKYKVVNVRGGA